MSFHVINLVPADDYRRDSYGILLESETVHRFTGRGIHNPSFDHKLEVWENRRRASDDKVIDPNGVPSSERYSYRFAALPTVISAHPGEPVKHGDVLQIGDLVEIRISGYAVGLLRIEAKPYHNPHGTLTTGQEA